MSPCSNETLISKGLRRVAVMDREGHLGSNETLISKGLRPNDAGHSFRQIGFE